MKNNYDKAFSFYTINFPSIDYDYIQLTIKDSLVAPINIKDVGFFKNETSHEEIPFEELDYAFALSQKEKTTQIHFTADRAYEINRIDFSISAPEFYNRYIAFYTLSKIPVKNKKPIIKKNVFKELLLNSKNMNTFKDISIKEKEFWIEVKNKDNQPITIDSIKLFQKKQFIVSPIKNNQEYTIVVGDKKLEKPNYDIENFKNTIEPDLPVIKIKNEHIFTQENKTEVKSIAFYEKPWFMWISIGFIALIILFFTLSLLKEADKN